MSQERLGNRLHLPSLSIKGFRGIDALTIDRLGRVTLIAGKNSVGKTTVLDAIQVYAARGHYDILSQLLESRQEVSIATLSDVSESKKICTRFSCPISRTRCVGMCPHRNWPKKRHGPTQDRGEFAERESGLSNRKISISVCCKRLHASIPCRLSRHKKDASLDTSRPGIGCGQNRRTL